MAVDQDNVSKILSVLSHPLRREILLFLSEKAEASFTDLLNLLKVDTGKLSFHLRTLSPFVEQTSAGKYKLSRAGESAVRVIHDVEGWAEVADIDRKESQLPLASFKRRSYAFLIDFAIILGITMVLVVLPQALSTGTISGSEISPVIYGTIALLWLYSTLLEGFNSQSLGKRILGLKVVRTDGKKMSYDHAAIRNFGKILPVLPFDLLIAWRLKNPTFRRYFDKFAGTTVIDLRTKPNQPSQTPNPA